MRLGLDGVLMSLRCLGLLFISFVLSSCLKQQESITPMAPVMTTAEIQREALMKVAEDAGHAELSEDAKTTLDLSSKEPGLFYLNIKFYFKNIDVFQAANIPNAFEQIGNSFMQSMAKLVLSLNGPRTIDLSDIDIEIPSSLDIDRSIVRSIQIKSIFLTYNTGLDHRSDFNANFSFIDSLELSREVIVPKLGKTSSLFLSYRKVRNFCLYKCLKFDILEDNLIDLLKPGTRLKMKPTLSIASLPEVQQLALDGQIEMRIGLKLPF